MIVATSLDVDGTDLHFVVKDAGGLLPAVDGDRLNDDDDETLCQP